MDNLLNVKSPSLSSHVGKAAGVICNDKFSTGDRAKLKRMVPTEPLPSAFYRFAFSHLPEDWERSRVEWGTIVAGIAIMAPSAHSHASGFGKVLAESNYSESRFERLLATEDEVLCTLVLRLARFLAAKGRTVDWSQIASLLLAKEDNADAIRMRIAKDYYRALKN
jgi:CRISPR system Cascade subunit CasB